jgi:Tfp pilus assembly protein PilV
MLRFLPQQQRRQAGDTIVEVIVVLAVLGLAVGISYATAHRSLLATRQAAENSQATALVQSQLETLKAYSAITGDPAHDIYQTASSYCIDAAGAVVANPAIPATMPTSLTSDHSKYAAACTVNTPYHIAIGYQKVDSSGNLIDTFTGRITWDDVQGSGQDTVTLVYRLHPPQP